jgi:hypothetical protein
MHSIYILTFFLAIIFRKEDDGNNLKQVNHMVTVSFDHNGKKCAAKISYGNRNGKKYYWADVIDKTIQTELGQTFTFVNNDSYNLSCLTPITAENRKAIAFLRRKIIQIFLHNSLQVQDGGFFQN